MILFVITSLIFDGVLWWNFHCKLKSHQDMLLKEQQARQIVERERDFIRFDRDNNHVRIYINHNGQVNPMTN
jgi:hypothetical protein